MATHPGLFPLLASLLAVLQIADGSYITTNLWGSEKYQLMVAPPSRSPASHAMNQISPPMVTGSLAAMKTDGSPLFLSPAVHRFMSLICLRRPMFHSSGYPTVRQLPSWTRGQVPIISGFSLSPGECQGH